MEIILIGLVVNIILSHLVGEQGKFRKIGYQTSLIISLCFSPIIGLLFVMSSLPKEKENKIEKLVNKNNSKIGIFIKIILFLIINVLIWYYVLPPLMVHLGQLLALLATLIILILEWLVLSKLKIDK
jgi:hypothetical protein